MLLKDILSEKGYGVCTIDPEASLDEAVDELVRHNVGSLLVCRAHGDGAEPRLLGIITERDVLRSHAARRDFAEVRVREVMSTGLITAAPTDRVQSAMALMTERRMRHLPVVSDGHLHGIISIGDIVKRLYGQLTAENHYMKSYILGEGAVAATARFAP